jgi:hypothetical protein
MHPLEKFTRKMEHRSATASMSPSVPFRGMVLSADMPVSAAPWVRVPQSVAPTEPELAKSPPPPPPSPEEVAAPFKEQIALLEAQLTAERARFIEVSQKIDLDLQHFESNARALIIDMALVAARVFVGETGSVEAIKNVVAKAIESLPLTPGMTLHVAAANAEALKGQLPATLRISVDPSLKPGDCRLESDSGGVDARLEVRAHELRQRLLAALLDGRGDAE